MTPASNLYPGYMACIHCRMLFQDSSPMADWHYQGTCTKYAAEARSALAAELDANSGVVNSGVTVILTCKECGAFDSHDPECDYAKEGSPRSPHQVGDRYETMWEGLMSAVDLALKRTGLREKTVDEIRSLCERRDI